MSQTEYLHYNIQTHLVSPVALAIREAPSLSVAVHFKRTNQMGQILDFRVLICSLKMHSHLAA
jgi:hypothetical protein